MDGTLLDSDSCVSKRNRMAIEGFMEEGGKFGIATGRNLDNAERFLKGLKLNGCCILANGSLLYDCGSGSYLEERGLNREAVEKFLKRCLREQPGINIQVYTKNMGFYVSSRQYADPEVVRDHIPVEFADMEDIRDKTWLKILFSAKPEEIDWLITQTAYLEAENCVSRVRSADKYYELLPAGSSKGYMLGQLKKYISDGSVIYAVGDYYNDKEMLQCADVGIAVKNAPQEVINCADRVCADCDHDAIADVIENIL